MQKIETFWAFRLEWQDDSSGNCVCRAIKLRSLIVHPRTPIFSTSSISGDRKRDDNDSHCEGMMSLFCGNMRSGDIIRLDRGVTWHLQPDKKSYRVGDTAKIAIKSTVIPATAVVSFARQGMIEQKRLELVAPTTSIELPIEATFVENVWVNVDVLNTVAPSINCTVPVAVEGVTAALKVTAAPVIAGFNEDATVVVVDAFPPD